MKEPRKRAWEKVIYTDAPDLPDLDELKPIADFLPPPEELEFRPKINEVEVTVMLNEDSVDFFKELAQREQTPYQEMIGDLVDEYVRRVRRKQETPNK